VTGRALSLRAAIGTWSPSAEILVVGVAVAALRTAADHGIGPPAEVTG
jgi:hypothetical protein